jgi:hypothetical protein
MKGRINIVDLAALVLLLAILPLAYGASLLFQTSRPQITEVGQVDTAGLCVAKILRTLDIDELYEG